LLFASEERTSAEDARDLVATALRAMGFGVPLDDPMLSGRYVGYRPVGPSPRWEPALLKLGGFARFLDQLLDMWYVNTADVHTAMGIFLWSALHWRPALSVVETTFRYTRCVAGCRRFLPEEVRQKLRAMRHLLPFIYVDLTRRVAPVVFVHDAAGADARATPLRGLRYGAWCLTIAAPPQSEIDEVWASIEAGGRKGLLPTVRGAMAGSKELV